jgi:hypothetical protein
MNQYRALKVEGDGNILREGKKFPGTELPGFPWEAQQKKLTLTVIATGGIIQIEMQYGPC